MTNKRIYAVHQKIIKKVIELRKYMYLSKDPAEQNSLFYEAHNLSIRAAFYLRLASKSTN